MRKFWVVCCMLLVGGYLSAQVLLEHPEMYVGAQAGMTGSTIHFSPSVDTEPFMAFGIMGGAKWRYIAEKHFGLQIELNYSQRGWKEANSYIRQTDYIELPMMTHLYIGNKVRGYLNIGPQISYLIAERSLHLPADISGHQYEKLQNRFDYGLCGGLGFQVRTPAGSYELDARFNYSLSNIYHASKSDYFSVSNNMNIAICFSWMWQVQ